MLKKRKKRRGIQAGSRLHGNDICRAAFCFFTPRYVILSEAKDLMDLRLEDWKIGRLEDWRIGGLVGLGFKDLAIGCLK